MRLISKLLDRSLGWAPYRPGMTAPWVAGSALRDRRGVTAVFFAGAAAIILGVTALGTEGGLWYMSRRNVQNAADAAAIAGALSAYGEVDPAGTVAALAQANGFTTGVTGPVTTAVSVDQSTYIPTSNVALPPFTAMQVSVQVQQQMPRLFSWALLGVAPPLVAATATAQVEPVGNACVLALSGAAAGALTISGNNAGVTISSACNLASNSADDTAISIVGSMSGAYSLSAVGSCVIGGSVCGLGNANLMVPPSLYHPASIDPFQGAAATIPACAPDLGQGYGPFKKPAYNGDIKVTAIELVPGTNYCSDLIVDGSMAFNWDASGNGTLTAPVVTVPNGVYYFGDAAVYAINNGMLRCSTTCSQPGQGMTFVFSGTPATPLTFRPGYPRYALYLDDTAMVLLYASATPPADPLSGLLFYGQGTAPAYVGVLNTFGTLVSTGIQDSYTMTGGIYFPHGALVFTGNTGVLQTPCLSLVADTITMTDAPSGGEAIPTGPLPTPNPGYASLRDLPSGAYVDGSSCSSQNTALAQVLAARLVLPNEAP